MAHPKMREAVAKFGGGLMDSMRMAKAGMGSRVEQDAWAQAKTAPAEDQDKEFRAYLTNEFQQRPGRFTGRIKQLFQKFTAAIRSFLYANGINTYYIKQLTPADLLAMSRTFGTDPARSPLEDGNVMASAQQQAAQGTPEADSIISKAVRGILDAGQKGAGIYKSVWQKILNNINTQAFKKIGNWKNKGDRLRAQYVFEKMMLPYIKKFHLYRNQMVDAELRTLVKEPIKLLSQLADQSQEDIQLVNNILLDERIMADWDPADRARLNAMNVNGLSGTVLVQRVRKSLQDIAKEAYKKGSWVVPDAERMEKIINATEPTYFPQIINSDAVRNDRAGFIELLKSPDAMEEFGWTAEQAENLAPQLADRIIHRAYNDQMLLRGNGALSANAQEALNKMKSAATQPGNFAWALLDQVGIDVDETLTRVLSARFASGLARTMTKGQREAIRKFYTTDPTDVLKAYTSQLGAKMAQRMWWGGWISKNGDKFVAQPGYGKTLIDLEAKALMDAEQGLSPKLAEMRATQNRMEQDGYYYSPTARMDYYIQRIYEIGKGNTAEAYEVVDWMRNKFFPAHMGMLGNNMSREVRTAQEALRFALSLVTLPFATITSLTELASVATRYADPQLERGILESLGTTIGALVKQLASDPLGRQHLGANMMELTGITRDVTLADANAMLDTDLIANKTIRGLSQGFFRKILLNWWTNTISAVAWRVAHKSFNEMEALGNEAAAEQEFASVGITKAQWTAYREDLEAGLMNDNLSMDDKLKMYDKHEAVYAAINEWVNMARLHPTASTRTMWGNDRRFMLFWMLNDYPYAFGAATFDRMAGQMREMAQNGEYTRGTMHAAMSGLMFMLLGGAAVATKDILRSGVGAVTGLSEEPPRFTEEPLLSVEGWPGGTLMRGMELANPLGQYEKVYNLAKDIAQDYPGNPFFNVFGGVVANFLLTLDQMGLWQALFRQLSFLDRGGKSELVRVLNTVTPE